MLRSIEKHKGFEFTVMSRRLLEVIIDDLSDGKLSGSNNGQAQLNNNIEKIAKEYRMAKWIKSYLHLIRILGNTSAHGTTGEIPENPEMNDFRVLLHCMAIIIPFWKQLVTEKSED